MNIQNDETPNLLVHTPRREVQCRTTLRSRLRFCRAVGLAYELGDVASPPAEAVERACAAFRAVGLKAY